MTRLVPFVLLMFLVACGSAPEAAGVAPTIIPATATSPPVPTPGCSDRAEEFIRLSKDVSEEWDDAFTLANSTSRGNLAPQIAELQRIRRNTNNLEVPDCAAAAKEHLVGAMDAGIDGFIAFLGQKPDATVNAQFDTMTREMTAYSNALLTMAGIEIPEPTATPEPQMTNVRLRVFGKAPVALITWTMPNEEKSLDTEKVPWSKVGLRPSGQLIQFKVTSLGGSLSCEVLIDEKQVIERKSFTGEEIDCSTVVP